MLAVTHFALGAAGGALLGLNVSPEKRVPLVVLSGLWAILPDGNKLLPGELTHAAHDSVLANIFWLHPTLDTFETAYPEVEGALALAALVFTAFYSYYCDTESEEVPA